MGASGPCSTRVRNALVPIRDKLGSYQENRAPHAEIGIADSVSAIQC
jgi:hypothetical protein